MKQVTNKLWAEKLFTHCSKNANDWDPDNCRWAYCQVFNDINHGYVKNPNCVKLSSNRFDKLVAIGLQLGEVERNTPTKEQKEITELKTRVDTLVKLVGVLTDEMSYGHDEVGDFLPTVEDLMIKLGLCE